MNNLFIIIQLVLALILILLILIQNKGTGFGRVWGGSNISFTRRGLEKLIFRLTFVVTGAFIIISALITVL
jgi:protein translocase SecG subunit